jgi:hypothetical protein
MALVPPVASSAEESEEASDVVVTSADGDELSEELSELSPESASAASEEPASELASVDASC